MSRKLVIDDGRTQRELLVVGTMIVGRDPESEISSSDPRLSRKHAEFRVTDSGVVVRDLQSRNGVRVNGLPITEHTLAPGDVVEIAHLVLRFLDESAAQTTETRPLTAPVTVSAPHEDDRTRVVAANAVTAAFAAAPVAVRAEGGDDRTRVLSGRAAQAGPAAPTGAMNVPTADIGELVIREVKAAERREIVAAAAADMGVQALAQVGWGRRVLVQGLLLALVVFLISVIPILAWQSRVFGASAFQSWTVLLPPLGASAFAGVMVAGLIARTAVRGLDRNAQR